MNENWQSVSATWPDGPSTHPKEEPDNFMNESTAPCGDPDGSKLTTMPKLQIVEETLGPQEKQYSSGKNLGLGVERQRQRDGLRNELYAEVLDARLNGPSEEGEWEKSLDQILRAIEAVPITELNGRVYVCDDGEIGIVWEEGNVHVEISAGVSEHIEYLVLNEDDGVREESIWKIESGDPMPTTLSSVLEGYRCHGET